MSRLFEIALQKGAQSFNVVLGQVNYRFTLNRRENSRGGAWYLDIERIKDGESVNGIPLVLGSDLLGQFKYKNFGSLYVVRTDGGHARPTFDDMGNNIVLRWSE